MPSSCSVLMKINHSRFCTFYLNVRSRSCKCNQSNVNFKEVVDLEEQVNSSLLYVRDLKCKENITLLFRQIDLKDHLDIRNIGTRQEMPIFVDVILYFPKLLG